MFDYPEARTHDKRPRAGSTLWRSAGVRVAPALVAAGLILAPAATAHTRAHSSRVAHGCANANTPAVAASLPHLRAAVVCLIDEQRAAHHLPALRANWRLDRSAQAWTDHMIATGDFSHGSDFSVRITDVGFVWSAAGENIATGFSTPRAVVSAWMASAGHCQNILSPSYSNVGTGVSRYAVRGVASGPATWTQDFALPMGHRAPSGDWGPANGCPY